MHLPSQTWLPLKKSSKPMTWCYLDVISSCRSTWIAVHSGVRQGCVITTILFSVFLVAILHLISNKFSVGKAKLQNKIVHLHSRHNIIPTCNFLLYTEHASKAQIQKKSHVINNLFHEMFEIIEITLSIQKTKVLYQLQTPPPPTQ